MANFKFVLPLVLAFVFGSESLRFGPDPITVESGILIVGQPAKLTCNYVKFRTESVREITWFAGYNGINTKIFHYQVTAGTKEGSTFSFIKTDESSATDSELSIVLPEFRSSVLTIGCEVEVLRDSGYGKLKTAKKLEESNLTVVNSQRHQLVMKAGNEIGSTNQNSESYAAVGEPFILKCMSVGVEPGPNLTLHVNGQPWEQNHPGQVFENPLDQGTLYNGNAATTSITGRLSLVTEDMFQGYGTKAMSVECVAKYGEHIFDSKKMVVKRAESLGQVSPYTANPYSAGSSNPYSGSASGSYSGSGSGSANPYLRDPARSGPGNPYQSDTGLEDPDQYLAPEIGRGGSERRPHYDANRNSGSGFGQNERQGKVYNNDEIHSRLLELVDPARHRHPGVPYDFHSGYFIMISDNLDEPDQQYGSTYGSATAAASTTTILGRLPDHVISAFQSNYGRYNQISTEKYRIKMEPVEVLNILGNFGFRVVDSTFSKNGKMIWTIEQRKFEADSTSGSLRGRDL